jgi:WD40 repeat protein
MRRCTYNCWLILLSVILMVLATAVTAHSYAVAQEDPPYHTVAHTDVQGTVDTLAWSPDGQMLAVGGDQGVWLYTADLEEITQLKDTGGTVQDLAWSPNSEMFASVSINDKAVRIWNLSTGQSVTALEGLIRNPSSVSWSPDGSLIACGDSVATPGSSAVKIWNVKTGEIVALIEGHSGTIVSVEWSPDGTKIISVSVNYQTAHSVINLWDANTSQTLFSVERQTDVESIAWSPDGDFFAVGSFNYEMWTGFVEIWDARSGVVATVTPIIFETGTPVLAWNADGSLIAALDSQRGAEIIVWPVLTGQTTILETAMVATDLAWHPITGNLLAVIGYDEQALPVVEIWSIQET